jgi:hypothetical protein
LKDVELALGSNLPTALAANLISTKAFEAAKRDDYETFVRERALTINEVVCKLAGWSPPGA